MTKGDFIVRTRPRSYLLTSQQVKIKEVCKKCNIRKGMSRQELVKAMTECVPAAYADYKEAKSGEGSNPI